MTNELVTPQTPGWAEQLKQLLNGQGRFQNVARTHSHAVSFNDVDGTLDHGALGGLSDDDHTIYLKADGTRNLSGNLTVTAGVTIDAVDVGTHAHTGAGTNGPQIDHANLSNVTANQHHNQAHGASDHTDRTRRLWLPAGTIGADAEWIAAAGTPDFAQRNSLYGAIAFDEASAEAILSLRTVMIPNDYVSGLSIQLVWTNLGAGAGNVLWRVGYSVATNLSAFPAFTTADLVIAAPAQNILSYNIFSALTPTVSAGHLVNLSCGRIASDATDTLANDAGFLGYFLTYTADM